MTTMDTIQNRLDLMVEKLCFVYGEERGQYLIKEIHNRIKAFDVQKNRKDRKKEWVDQKDIILITYGDQIKEKGKSPMQSLHEFLNIHVKDSISGVHILPFYPYSSDDGFSVIDYFKVNPELGAWQDIHDISDDYDVMFDAVINHISAQSEWFQEYLKGNKAYKDYFIEADPKADYSTVTRPRALPLLTKFETSNGTKYIWTTFSEDQIDMNYKNEEVLLIIIDLLLFYIKNGAKLIRMDAIGYLWKRLGTSCIHLEEAHQIIQIFRDIFETVAPETIIITETNVPHKENTSYLGNGYNEAHMVYQFPLPPLTLHTLHTGNSYQLLTWADSLESISSRTTFFNFLASHDGIGVMPVKGILTKLEIEGMVQKVKEYGGHVSYKDNGDGTKSPYELNINYLEALSHPNDNVEIKVKRFIASQSILLSMMGVPGIYVHSLLGSTNYHNGVKETGRFRTINREKLNRNDLEAELQSPDTLRYQVLTAYKRLIQKRREEKAFHPNGLQKVLFLDEKVYSLIRTSVDHKEKIICLTNISNETISLMIDRKKVGLEHSQRVYDVISEQRIDNSNENIQVTLSPYQVMWMKVQV